MEWLGGGGKCQRLLAPRWEGRDEAVFCGRPKGPIPAASYSCHLESNVTGGTQV